MGQSNWWHKNLSSAVGLLPGNFLRICYKRNNSVQTVSILSGRFQYCLDSFNKVWTVLILSGQFLSGRFKFCLKTVRTVLKPRGRFRWATINSLRVVISIFCALILYRSLLTAVTALDGHRLPYSVKTVSTDISGNIHRKCPNFFSWPLFTRLDDYQNNSSLSDHLIT